MVIKGVLIAIGILFLIFPFISAERPAVVIEIHNLSELQNDVFLNSSQLNSTYVPYNGATQNVVLGIYNISGGYCNAFVNASFIQNEIWVEEGSANKTLVSCSNITGNASDLCTITSGGSGNTTQEIKNAINSTIRYVIIANNSDNWNNTQYPNDTQMNVSNGQLNIRESWLNAQLNYARNTTLGIEVLINATILNQVQKVNNTAVHQMLLNGTNMRFGMINASNVTLTTTGRICNASGSCFTPTELNSTPTDVVRLNATNNGKLNITDNVYLLGKLCLGANCLPFINQSGYFLNDSRFITMNTSNLYIQG